MHLSSVSRYLKCRAAQVNRHLLLSAGVVASLMPLLALAICVISPPTYRETIPASAISPFEGFAYSAPVPTDHFAPWLTIRGDAISQNAASNLKLLDIGALLGPAYSMHADIEAGGRGRFSHWGQSVIFSAFDNSDPRKNGHTYSYQVKSAPSIWFYIVAILLPICAFETLIRDGSGPRRPGRA
jgi:hypothetical protein